MSAAAGGGGGRITVSTRSEEARRALELGRLAAFHYRFDRARSHLDAAIATDPDLALAYIYRGGSETRSSEADARRGYFDRALALRNRVTQGERSLIDAFRTFLLNGDHDHAIEIFRELSDAYPDDVYPPAHLALRLLHAKQAFDEAAAWFEEARRRAPDFAPVHNWLGFTLRRAGRADQGERVLQESLERFPDDPDGLFVYGDFLLDEGRPDEAARYLERALARDPAFDDARQRLEEARRAAGPGSA